MNIVSVSSSSLILAGRAIRRTLRTPEVTIQTVIFPIVLLLSMLAAFSTAVEAFSGGEAYAQRLVPGLIVCGLMFGSTGSAVGLFTDLHNGYLMRIRTMGTDSLAPILGVALAEMVRSLAAVATLTAVGALAGFRFSGGVIHIIAFCLTAAMASLAFPWLGMWLATKASSVESFLPALSGIFLVLLFFSGAMVPLDAYPQILQPFVEWNPGSAYVVLLDSLARGAVSFGDVAHAVLWSVGITAIFAALTTRNIARHSL